MAVQRSTIPGRSASSLARSSSIRGAERASGIGPACAPSARAGPAATIPSRASERDEEAGARGPRRGDVAS